MKPNPSWDFDQDSEPSQSVEFGLHPATFSSNLWISAFINVYRGISVFIPAAESYHTPAGTQTRNLYLGWWTWAVPDLASSGCQPIAVA